MGIGAGHGGLRGGATPHDCLEQVPAICATCYRPGIGTKLDSRLLSADPITNDWHTSEERPSQGEKEGCS
jgi:hypothetical protein